MTDNIAHPSLRPPTASRIDRPHRTFVNLLILGIGAALVGLFSLYQNIFVLDGSIVNALIVLTVSGFINWQAFRARQGHVVSAVLITLILVYTANYFITFRISGLGALVGVITLIIGYTLISQSFPQHQILRGITVVTVASISLILLDLFLPTLRNPVPPSLFAIVATLLSGIVLLYFLILAREFKNYDLRFKFISAVTALAMISIVITTVVVSLIVQNILTNEVGRSIHDVTGSRASGMGEALAREVNLLQTVSLNPIVRREMILQNVDYGTLSRGEIIRELEAQDAIWRTTTLTQNELLFQENLNSAAARELRAFQAQFLDNLELFITDRYGGLVAASHLPDRFYYGNDTWWRGAYKNGDGGIYISEPAYNPVQDTYQVTIALPFYDRNDNNLLGIIHASYSLNELLSILLVDSEEALGEAGQIDLIFQTLALSINEAGDNYEASPLNNTAVARQQLSETNELYAVSEINNERNLVAESRVFTTSPYGVINSLGWVILAYVPEAVALQGVNAQQRTQILLGVFILSGAILAAGFVGRIVAQPILELTDTAQRVAAGDLNARAEIKTGDEIADLAVAFNNMTNRLQQTQQHLESRVAERTHALELSAQISRSLSTIVDRDELVLLVVRLLREAFSYYHVHIYLLNEAEGKLILAGGTGEVGQTLLAQGHSLQMGQGLVGRAAESNSAVLIPDVSLDESWIANPLLPDTQAELAIPISIGGKVLGVLDVQNQEAYSLNENDLDLVGSIANQVAIGLRNAELYTTLQRDAEREATINQISQKIQDTNDISSALKVAVREIGLALNASDTAVHLIGKQSNGQQNR